MPVPSKPVRSQPSWRVSMVGCACPSRRPVARSGRSGARPAGPGRSLSRCRRPRWRMARPASARVLPRTGRRSQRRRRASPCRRPGSGGVVDGDVLAHAVADVAAAQDQQAARCRRFSLARIAADYERLYRAILEHPGRMAPSAGLWSRESPFGGTAATRSRPRKRESGRSGRNGWDRAMVLRKARRQALACPAAGHATRRRVSEFSINLASSVYLRYSPPNMPSTSRQQ